MMRVSGEVEFVNDDALNARLLKERPWLQAVGKEQAEQLLAVFILSHGEARFWTMANNMHEAEVEKVRF